MIEKYIKKRHAVLRMKHSKLGHQHWLHDLQLFNEFERAAQELSAIADLEPDQFSSPKNRVGGFLRNIPPLPKDRG